MAQAKAVLMYLQTKRCLHCDKPGIVEVNDDDGRAFESGVGHIQDVMPNTPAPIREQLMTGTHPKCWDEIMSEEEY
jgi:hypothetical protein